MTFRSPIKLLNPPLATGKTTPNSLTIYEHSLFYSTIGNFLLLPGFPIGHIHVTYVLVRKGQRYRPFTSPTRLQLWRAVRK